MLILFASLVSAVLFSLFVVFQSATFTLAYLEFLGERGHREELPGLGSASPPGITGAQNGLPGDTDEASR